MSAHFPHWVGRVVGDDLSLAAFVGDTEHTAVFQTTFAGQNAAIKLIAADESAERHLERFELASKLSHPNLLRVLRFGRTQIDDAPFVYVVTEFAEENLAQVLPDRALTKEEAQQVLQATLDALTYLHQQGLVHSDLKPANIMAANDQLKLSIDGVHRTGESLSRQPDPHDAPEASSAVTAASDIWSLGVTLVQILTQQLPGAPASPNAGPVVPESVPAPFREIAQHCLLRTPELRWSLADISNKLNPKSKHTPTPAPSPAVTKPSPKPVRKEAPLPVATSRAVSKRPFIFVGIVAIIVAAIVVIPRLSHDQSHEQATTPQPASTPSSQSVPAQAAPSQSTPEQSTASPEQSAPATPANNETESAAP
ncbi:MAG TPA: protein kinase, partial [Terriglobales bacterium]|nr:protein kinase [Terriglobales bacterium]